MTHPGGYDEPRPAGSRLDKLSLLALEGSAVALGLALVYVSWGLFSGEIPELARKSPEEQTRIFNNVILATNVMLISLSALTLITLFRAYRDRFTGYVFTASGFILLVMAPLFIGLIYPGALLDVTGATAFVQSRFRLMSLVLLAPGVVLVVIDIVLQIREGAEERKLVAEERRRAKEEKAPPIIFAGKCYNTPYCRDFIRSRCPVYEQRKSCWKLRVGCYCDESVILGAVVDPLSPRKTFDPRYSRSFVAAKSKEFAGKKGKERCRNCFLYQHHQSQKYKLAAPLSFAATIALMWKGIPLLKIAYDKFMAWSIGIIQRLSYSGAESLALAPRDPGYDVFFWFLAFVFSLLFLAYLLQALEWAIFKQQW
jgi:hypothetical protein